MVPGVDAAETALALRFASVCLLLLLAFGCAKPKIEIVSKKLEKSGDEVVFVPAGEFTMGSETEDREKPVRKVTLDAYWIGKYPVTVAQFR